MTIKIGAGEKTLAQLKPRITVIGVGGGGGNAVNNMISKNLSGVDFIVANTDAQALEKSPAPRKIQIGLETTRGLGSGARPEVGKMSAEEAKEEISAAIDGANMVFITAGMGGGTGSGAAPVVAKIAKEKGILTIGVVTKPFDFEGKKRQEIANKAIEEFTKEVDSIIIIPNQNLFRITDKNTTLADSFVMADDVLYSGVRSITDLMIEPGLINLDFADVKSIMEDKGKAIMGTGEAEGEDRAVKAAEQALANPLLDDCSMRGAKGVLINITGSLDVTLHEVDAAANRIKKEVDEDANIIFGSSISEELNGKIRVSVVATGIGDSRNSKVDSTPVYASSYIDDSYHSTSDEIIPQTEIDTDVVLSDKESKLENLPDEDNLFNDDLILNDDEKSVKDDSSDDETFIDTLSSDNEVNNGFINKAHDEDFDKFKDFDMIEMSQVSGDLPKASALFNAIINEPEEKIKEDDLDSVLTDIDDTFSPDTSVLTMEDEPEIFSGVLPKEEVKETTEVLVSQNRTPTFLERITGISIAKRNRKEQKEENVKTEPVLDNTYDDLSVDNFDEDKEKLNLDIPSFLRTHKN